MAIVYEILVQIIIIIILYVLVIIALIIAPVPNPNQINAQFVIDHEEIIEWAAGIGAFVQAFLTAALVEELAKYFSYWMVEHPDFLSPADILDTTRTTEGGSHVNEVAHSPDSNPSNSLTPEEEIQVGQNIDDIDTDIAEDSDHRNGGKKSVVSLAGATTVAMVATALGFACCENLIYIFGYSQPGISNEVSTLVMRSLLPLHPIAAAIQSIGVIRRDLEGETSYGLGRIFLPAFLYHGSYDFVLMFLGALQQIHWFEKLSDDDYVQREYKDEHQEENDSLRDSMFSLFIALTIFVAGIVYYVIQARAQHKRLLDLDLNRQQRSLFLANRLV